jgi:hypothetical protein
MLILLLVSLLLFGDLPSTFAAPTDDLVAAARPSSTPKVSIR